MIMQVSLIDDMDKTDSIQLINRNARKNGADGAWHQCTSASLHLMGN